MIGFMFYLQTLQLKLSAGLLLDMSANLTLVPVCYAILDEARTAD
jgi:hypothetical protein